MSIPHFNRLKQFTQHNPHLPYLFHGPYSKAARGSNLSPSTFSRLRRGLTKNPSFRTLVKLTEFFEQHYGRRIDPREIFYPGGQFKPRLSFAFGELVRQSPTEWHLARQTAENYRSDSF